MGNDDLKLNPRDNIVGRLKQWNRSWIESSTDPYSGDTKKSTTGTATDPLRQTRQQQESEEPTETTALETARMSLSAWLDKEILPAHERTQDAENHNKEESLRLIQESLVPTIFSVLYTKADDTLRGSATSDEKERVKPLGTANGREEEIDKQIGSMKGNELKQIEWHVVMVLELWASCRSSKESRSKDSRDKLASPNSIVLNAFADAINSFREYESSRRNIYHQGMMANTRRKQKKKSKKRKKKRKSKLVAFSTKEKESLVLDHLVQILSRAPFLLSSDLPLSEFLTNHCWNQERQFWERLPFVLSHILQSFEISNPYLEIDASTSDENEIQKGLESTATISTNNEEITDPHKTSATAKAKQKSSRAKLQERFKNKKRQKLASISLSKRKHRGSHFNSNLGDISKLLDKKNIANRSTSGPLTKLKQRKAERNVSKVVGKRRHSLLDKTNPIPAKPTDGRAKRRKSDAIVPKRSIQRTTEPTMNDDVAKKRQVSGHETDQEENFCSRRRNEISQDTQSLLQKETLEFQTGKRSINRTVDNGASVLDSFPMTPKRSRTKTEVVGETPIASRGHDIVIEETPVPSKRTTEVVGETPTSFGTTPLSCASELRQQPQPFFSPPPLPSPSKLLTSQPTLNEPKKQQAPPPTRLFGAVRLAKRTTGTHNATGPANGMCSGIYPHAKSSSNGITKKNGSRRTDASSIDVARAYLRRRSM